MNRALITFAILLLAGMTGCFVTSVHPLFNDNEIVFDPSITGHWKNGDHEDWIFEKGEDNTYLIKYKTSGSIVSDPGDSTQGYHEPENNDTAVFTGKLGRIGGTMFLDMFPKENNWGGKQSSTAGFYQVHFLPMHSFMKVEKKQDSLILTYLSQSWLDDMVHQKKTRIAVTEFESGSSDDKPKYSYALTAGTKELQAFVGKYANDTSAFKDPVRLGKLRIKND